MSSSTIIKSNPSETKDRIAFLVLFLFLASEVYCLIFDIPFLGSNSTDNQVTGKPIANLMLKKDFVQKQRSGTLTWEDVSESQAFVQNDSLLTLEHSKAEVAFLDGTGIVLEENSMVKLERIENPILPNRFSIKLLRGRLRKGKSYARLPLNARPGEIPMELGIQVDHNWIKFSPNAELSVSSNPRSSLTEVIVEQGEIEIENLASQTKLKVKRNEQIILPKNKDSNFPTPTAVSHSPISPKLEEGIDPEIFSEAEGLPYTKVKFVWQIHSRSTMSNPQILEVSTDPSFSSNLFGQKIAATEPPLSQVEAIITLPVNSRATPWYWRIRSAENASNSNAVTDTLWKFWIQPKPIPTLFFPANGAHSLSGDPVKFLWSQSSGSIGYEFQWKGKTAIPLKEPSYQANPIEAGNHPWRVRTQFPKGPSLWSEFRALVVDPRGPPPPARIFAPEPLSPIQRRPKK